MTNRTIWTIAAIVAVAMFLFPPVNLEKRFPVNTLEPGNKVASAELHITEFIGWRFIGGDDIKMASEQLPKPSDPMNPTLLDRLNAIDAASFLNEGTKVIHFWLWGLQFLGLAIVTGLALIGLRMAGKRKGR